MGYFRKRIWVAHACGVARVGLFRSPKKKTLDTVRAIWDTRNRMKKFSTRAAAKELGLSSTALDRYVAAGKIPAPNTERIGGLNVRIWSEADIERVRKILPKITNGRKTRYKKKKK